MRNPFRKQDENVRPYTNGVVGVDRRPNGSPVKPAVVKEKAPVEYQLSEINDSGVFVEPSDDEPSSRPSFWTTSSSRSTTSSKSRSLFDENEPFNISRESFDSYRRSFDISARSPVIIPEAKPRSSLDSRTYLGPPRHSNSFRRPLEVPGTQQEQPEEPEGLEDVALDDPKPQGHKKKSMFSRLMDSESHSERPGSQQDGGKTSWHHFGGRKRGQSGQGSELGQIPIKREEDKEATPKPEVQPVQIQPLQSQPAVKKEERPMPAAENTQAPDIRVESAR